jgi:hypothetical protein
MFTQISGGVACRTPKRCFGKIMTLKDLERMRAGELCECEKDCPIADRL